MKGAAAAGALLLLTLAGARAAAAQSFPKYGGFVGVTFRSASAYEDGYIHGNVIIDYSFRICSGDVQVMYGVRPGSAQGATTYWYKGHNYGARSEWAVPAEPSFTTQLRISFNASEVWSKEVRPSIGTDLSCGFGTQWVNLGPASKFGMPIKTDRERQDLLNRFTFDVSITREPMRSSAVEAGLARELAAARKDSLDRAQAAKARADSIERARLAKVRADSVESARVAKARTDSAAGARSAQAQAPGGGASTRASTRTSSSAGARMATTAAGAGSAAMPNATSAAAQQQARTQARDRARQDSTTRSRDDAANRARQLAAVQQQLADQQRAREERDAQVQQAAQEIGNMVGNILEARRQEQERRDARELARMQAKEEHQLRARAAFLQAPNRPTCTRQDVIGPVALDGTTSGRLTLDGCRLADSTAGALYSFDLDGARDVTVWLSSPNFYERVALEDENHVVARAEPGKMIERHLAPGHYYLVVSSEVPGETGDYTLSVHRSEVSKVPGLALGLVLGGGPVSMPGASGSSGEAGLRVGLGFGDYVMLLAQGATGADDQGAGMDYLEYGGRVYLKSKYDKYRPFVHYAMGKRDYSVSTGSGILDLDFYEGKGSTMGAGVEWFGARRLGMEAGIYRATGRMKPVAGTKGSDQDLSSLRFTVGMTFHK